ncbi:MAG: L-2-hydroxyglutarate oxidase [bacterium]|nr:L-2-hydroxyglutarate oxidase [bacterium]
MNNIYDVIVIGAGIVGASVAYKLGAVDDNLKVAVIDKEPEPNRHQTGRNSGVIHSGVYYPKGSLKSENCISGYNQLLPFLAEHNVEYKLPGKLIAAADETEYEELDRLYKNAELVGLDVEYMDEHQIKEIDPAIVTKKGFYVKETGITDYGEVLNKLVELSSAQNSDYYFGEMIESIHNSEDQITIKTRSKALSCKYLINCAGLNSDRIFELSTGERSTVKIVPFKGEYFEVPKENYASDIAIYPVPNPNFPFLGVHLTRMIDGSLKVGPNAVLSLHREGYDGFEVNIKDAIEIISNSALYNIARSYSSTVVKELLRQKSKAYFERNVKKYWSNYQSSDIIGYSCGIRAQATENGKLLNDFRIEKNNNQVHVLNAPSPAATSCLAIADTIIEELDFNK